MQNNSHNELTPIAISVSEAARLLGVSRPKIYQLMQQDHLPSFKVGTRTLIPVADLHKWVTARAKKGGADHAANTTVSENC